MRSGGQGGQCQWVRPDSRAIVPSRFHDSPPPEQAPEPTMRERRRVGWRAAATVTEGRAQAAGFWPIGGVK